MKEKLKNIIYEEQNVNPSAFERVLENSPIERETAKEIINKFEGKINYPSGIKIYGQDYYKRNIIPYKKLIFYNIFQPYDEELGLFPKNFYNKIVEQIHSFNVNKRAYVRNKILKGKAKWKDFNKKLDEWYPIYQKKVENLVEKAEWPKEKAKLIVPLLFNMKDPDYEDDTVIIEIKGKKEEFFVTK